MKYVIISNRLPLTFLKKNNKLHMTRSSGGLSTGLDSLDSRVEKHWVGWPGLCTEEVTEQKKIRNRLSRYMCHPVFLSDAQIQEYYEGYSNSTLWPLCHYFFSYIECEAAYWKAYREVNEVFCEEALKVIEPGDMVWIHDYHLMLLPAMIRKRAPDAAIGYFHHIPFPSYEMFRSLPERNEILRGLLGADLIAFHTYDYMRHFISALYRVLNHSCHMDEVHLENRIAKIEAFPMGINYEMYNNAIEIPKVRDFVKKLKRMAGSSKIILSVDRLDYSKGILTRLKGFASFLKNNPDCRGKVILILVVVPSRSNVEMYAELKTKIDNMIGDINGTYSTVDWVPVQYFYRSFSFADLSALYNAADIALVTPLRDGMNLVAKEYLAAKGKSPGVLILSEMAGAAAELSDAIIINPTDVTQIESAILQALTMPEKDQLIALRKMQKVISRQTVHRWANSFLDELEKVKKRNRALKNKLLEKDNVQNIQRFYSTAKKRLLVLDYDGTLVPFVKNPARAHPAPELLELLHALAADSRNKVVVCSGRDKESLERWLGGLPIDLAAEHGAFFKENGLWHEHPQEKTWNDEILDILKQITDKTANSRIEIKKTSLAWHYREVDTWLADLRVTQLVNALINPCTRLGLQIMRGSKVVEIKFPLYTKGTEIRRLLKGKCYEFIMAVGDDVTDDDMFSALPPEAITIKIGGFSDLARYCLPAQHSVIPFLAELK